MTTWGVAAALGEMKAVGAGEVQVWRVDVGEVAGAYGAAFAELVPEEQARAKRFRVEPARSEYVFGRCLLRRLLGQAAGVKAGEIVLTAGRYGKPEARGLEGIGFNVSHSRGVVVVAISGGGTVGVDVEGVDERRNVGGGAGGDGEGSAGGGGSGGAAKERGRRRWVAGFLQGLDEAGGGGEGEWGRHRVCGKVRDCAGGGGRVGRLVCRDVAERQRRWRGGVPGAIV